VDDFNGVSTEKANLPQPLFFKEGGAKNTKRHITFPLKKERKNTSTHKKHIALP